MSKASKSNRISAPKLNSDDVQGLRDYWDVYEKYRQPISEELIAYTRTLPEFAFILEHADREQMAEQQESARALQRSAVVDGQWDPYLADLLMQGARYAQMGLSFHAWYEIIAAFRVCISPYLVREFDGDSEKLLRAMHSMDLYIDITMGGIGEGYLETKEQIIRQQQEAIREISTPVLQLREGLVILPLIGVLDSHRAKQVTEQLLHAIRSTRARTVVMDITGVPTVDSAVANYLTQTVEAARLMGASVIITGLSADIAQTLVRIGVDLDKLSTKGDLQSGVEEAERLLDLNSLSRKPAVHSQGESAP